MLNPLLMLHWGYRKSKKTPKLITSFLDSSEVREMVKPTSN